MTGLLSFCMWLSATALSTYVKESLWGFQIIVAVHIVSLTFSIGTITWFDLRLLGASLPGTAAAKVYRQLIPFAAVGFGLMFATGLLLFAGYPVEAYHNVFFRAKLAVIAIAGVNAVVYHLFSARRAEAIERETGVLPRGARIAAALSLALWTVVIICGRMISYTLYSR